MSKWKVTSNMIDNTKKFAIYRIIDPSEPDHSGNREYASKGKWFDHKETALAIAEMMNEWEEMK